MERLVDAVVQLFRGAPGSDAQRAANEWLLQLQHSDDAWSIALQVLRTDMEPASSPDPSVRVVALQLLRAKVDTQWHCAAPELRSEVRETITQWLHATSARVALEPSVRAAFRLACVTMAALIARDEDATAWSMWCEQARAHSLVQTLEVFGALPQQLASLPLIKETAPLSAMLMDVVSAVTRAFQLEPPLLLALESALRCLESWSIGCMPDDPTFGLTITHLLESDLLSALLNRVMCLDNDQLCLTAAEIVADALGYSPTESLDDATHAKALVVRRCMAALQASQPILDATRDQTEAPQCRAIAQIASALGLHHSIVIFSLDAESLVSTMQRQALRHDGSALAASFLDIMLACSLHRDRNVMQPTLEFWFFLLDQSVLDGRQWELLAHAIPMDYLLDVLRRAVNALLQHCRFPSWFVAAQRLPSTNDDDEIEEVLRVRREITDTLLSLFSKWPAPDPVRLDFQQRPASCVKGLVELLRSTSDVAMLEALLSIFEACVELFDMASTDESDDECANDASVSVRSDGSEGTQVMLQVLHDALGLPLHPLLISGLARLVRALSAALVLPGQTYIKVAIAFFRALEVPTTYAVATEELRHISHALVKYTEIQDRHDVLNAAVAGCRQSIKQRTTVKAHGDLLEAAFRMTRGLDATGFGGFCNAVLSPLVELGQNPDAQVTADAIVLMGRAIRGIDDPYLALSTTDQIWSVITKSIASLQSSTCEDRDSPPSRLRLAVLRFFMDAVTSCEATPLSRLQEIALCCLQWLPLAAVSPFPLRCLSAVVSNDSAHRQRDAFYPIAAQIVKGSLTVIWRDRVHVDPYAPNGVLHEHLTLALTSSTATSELLATELVDMFMLLRQCIRFFPLVLAEPQLVVSIWRFACMLPTIDHQEQSLIDAACDWLLDTIASKELLSVPAIASLIQAEPSVALLRGAMTFVGPLQTPWTSPSYRPRSVWLFLFQLLHSPRIPESQRSFFGSVLLQLLTTDATVLPSLTDATSRAHVAAKLCSLHHRHRFVSYLVQLSRHGNGAL